MKEPKKVILSEDGDTVLVGEREFEVEKLAPAQIALVMKERCKGFLGENGILKKKAASYAIAAFRIAMVGIGCWIASKFFQNIDVAENFLRGAWFGLSAAALYMSGKSIYYNKKKKGLLQDYEDDQHYLGMEIVRRQLHGEDTKMAEDILEEITKIEREGYEQN